jgi:hypothetical protein
MLINRVVKQNYQYARGLKLEKLYRPHKSHESGCTRPQFSCWWSLFETHLLHCNERQWNIIIFLRCSSFKLYQTGNPKWFHWNWMEEHFTFFHLTFYSGVKEKRLLIKFANFFFHFKLLFKNVLVLL